MLPISRPVHICIADPSQNPLKAFEKAASEGTQEFDWWNVTSHTKPGDLAIFYFVQPVSAFCATATVGRKLQPGDAKDDAGSPWFGSPYRFWMSNVRMLNGLTLQKARKIFPAWRYLKRPVVASIPNKNTSPALVEKLLEFIDAPVASTESAIDIAEPPPKVKTTTYRILRDSAIAQEVKRMHDFRCQICGTRIELRSGSYYAEAHHVRPLGGIHQGLDTSENILCVCPNHHAELDYGARKIMISELRKVRRRRMSTASIDYHNNFHGFGV